MSRNIAPVHNHMATLILSMFALLGCVFLIYALFHWLREELNPKRPQGSMKRSRQRTRAEDRRGLCVVRAADRRNV